MTYRAAALLILAVAVVLGAMSGYLFASGATWEGAGMLVCALGLVGLSAYTAADGGRQ